jgi:transcriptional regulator with XRE-family HTH domain
MDVIKRISDLTKERGWSTYRLAYESGLSSSTIANIYRRNTIPSLITLESICSAFGITLCQFFAEDMDAVPLTREQKELFDKWANLTPTQKKLIEELINEFK